MLDLSNEATRHLVLTNGPRGAWGTVPGSHTELFDERIEFNPDGTGRLHSRSVLRGQETLSFLWRVAGYGVIECQPQYAEPTLDDHGLPEAPDWFRIEFSIEPHRTDAGSYWALRERATNGFWELSTPLIALPATADPVQGVRAVR